jgi:hypothetical protein
LAPGATGASCPTGEDSVTAFQAFVLFAAAVVGSNTCCYRRKLEDRRVRVILCFCFGMLGDTEEDWGYYSGWGFGTWCNRRKLSDK